MTKRPTAISPILGGLAKNFGFEKGMLVYTLKEQWEEIAGLPMATHTHPLEIRHKTLYLLIDSSAWMHQISFLKKEIIEKVNGFLKNTAVDALHFKIGPIPRAENSIKKESPPDGEAPYDPAVEAFLSPLTDGELQIAVRKAIKRHLAKRQ